MKPGRAHRAMLTPSAVRFIRKWRAHRKATGKRIRPLRKQLCAMWGISVQCFEDAARGRTYWWVR